MTVSIVCEVASIGFHDFPSHLLWLTREKAGVKGELASRVRKVGDVLGIIMVQVESLFGSELCCEYRSVIPFVYFVS